MTKPTKLTLRERITQLPIMYVVIGVIVVMALASLYVTSAYNSQQKKYVQCGGAAVVQTIEAIRARDKAALDLADSDKSIVRARYNLLLLLANAPNKPNMSMAEALGSYESSVQTFETAIDNYTNAIRTAPLPAQGCLVSG